MATDQPLVLVDFVDESTWKRSTGAVAPSNAYDDSFEELEDAYGKKFHLNFYFMTHMAVSNGEKNLGSTIVVTVAPSDSSITLDQKSLGALKKRIREFCHRVAISKRAMHKVFGFRAWFLVPPKADASMRSAVIDIFREIRSEVTSQ